MNRRFGLRHLFSALLVLALLSGVFLLWSYRDSFRSPQDLYLEARTAKPERAAELYARLADQLPALKEYAMLWTAEAQMPSARAMQTLQGIVDFQPQSPLAYDAHLARARYYASIGARAAADEYRAALTLNDGVALRLELARWLERTGDDKGAYAEYHALLSKQPDAFEGMRRTGEDPLAVAKDLIAATYDKDALETLQDSDSVKALPLRAEALAGLGRYDEARAAYQAWLQSNPDDVSAQMGLARTLVSLNRTKEALALYRQIKTADSQTAQADLLEDTDPNQAMTLDLNSPYPVGWWNATGLLEAQKRLTETLPLYARVAKSDSLFADDAAYRLYVLGKRLGDSKAQADGRGLLDGFGLNALAVRANDSRLNLPVAPPLDMTNAPRLDIVEALERIGRQDLVHLELVLAARLDRAPEADLRMAQALATRGYVVDAQSIAEKYIRDHTRAPLEFWELSYPRAYSETVQAAAAEFKVDPPLIWAVMREESRYDPNALSYAGARGLMQLMPSTQTWIAGQLHENGAPGDAYVPQSSIRMGAWYLHFLSDYFKGDLDLTIAAYNGGAASVDSWQKNPLVANRDDWLRWIGFGETREYLEKVSLSYRVYQELYGAGRTPN